MRPKAGMANREGDVDLRFAQISAPQLTLWLGLASLGFACLGSAWLGSGRLGSAGCGWARLGWARLGSGRLLFKGLYLTFTNTNKLKSPL